MTLAAADMRVCDGAFAFGAVGFNADAPLEEREAAVNAGVQLLVFAGVGADDVWDGTGSAEVRCPGLVWRGALQQAALFSIPSTKIISVKMGTFHARRGSH
jgi:hypothetical protein